MRKLLQKLNTSMIMITHDLGIVAEVCDTVAVVYAGEVVEFGTREQIFHSPLFPYTLGLFGSLPKLDEEVRRLSPIEGLPPDPVHLPQGCASIPDAPMQDRNVKKSICPYRMWAKAICAAAAG